MEAEPRTAAAVDDGYAGEIVEQVSPNGDAPAAEDDEPDTTPPEDEHDTTATDDEPESAPPDGEPRDSAGPPDEAGFDTTAPDEEPLDAADAPEPPGDTPPPQRPQRERRHRNVQRKRRR